MATWKYKIQVNKDAQLHGGDVVAATVERIEPAGTINTSLYELAKATGRLTSSGSNVEVNAGDVYLMFGFNTLTSNTDTLPKLVRFDLNTNVSNIPQNIVESFNGTSGSVNIQCYHRSGGGVGIRLNYTEMILEVQVNKRYNDSVLASYQQNVVFGQASRVTITNTKTAGTTHSLSYEISTGGKTYRATANLAQGVLTANLTPPVSWASYIPTTSSIAGFLVLKEFYNDTQVLEKKYNIVFSIGNSVPTMSDIVLSVYGDRTKDNLATNEGLYIQNVCGVSINIASGAASMGATIKAINLEASTGQRIEMDYPIYNIDTSASVSNIQAHIASLKVDGTVKITATITDSRDKKVSKQATFNVVNYAVPRILQLDAYRCDANGQASENGTYVNFRSHVVVSPVMKNGTDINSVNRWQRYIAQLYEAEAGPASAVRIAPPSGDVMPDNTSYIVSASLDVNKSYYVRVSMADNIVATASTRTQFVTSVEYAIHVKNGGRGVAFGKVAQHERTVQVSPQWQLHIGDKEVYDYIHDKLIIYTETSAEPAKVKGAIWLKKVT